jgi:hypothetical protein
VSVLVSRVDAKGSASRAVVRPRGELVGVDVSMANGSESG